MSQTELPVFWRQVERAEPPAAAEPEERGGVGHAEAAVGAEGEPALARGSPHDSGSGRTMPVLGRHAGVVELDPKALLPYSAVASIS